MTDLNFSNQVEMITLDQLVPNNHIYRKFMKLWDLSEIKIELEKIEVASDHKGYGIFRLFLCLLIAPQILILVLKPLVLTLLYFYLF